MRKRSVRWVWQEDLYGCGCAAVAMLVGLDYQDIKEYVERKLDVSGMTGGDWEQVLAELGYATSKIYGARQYPWQNCKRDVWPPEPWADVHLCGVLTHNASHGSHMVVMLSDGSVLDPTTPEPKRLTDYQTVYSVAAVVPAPRPPQLALRVHRDPEMEFSA